MNDLGNWASEKYVVSDPVFDEEDVAEADRRLPQQDEHNSDETIH
jgi:endogenous inhibitor of DNA gyrase (YacG/DUF329 family)